MQATPLTLADTRIRQEVQGRYCLNDLHRTAVAAGANARTKEPGKFLSATRTQELLALLAKEAAESVTQNLGEGHTQNLGTPLPPVVTINDGIDNGTYVCIQLVIAYGQFVSAAFDLKVINTFLAVQHAEHALPHIQARKFWDEQRPHWAQISALALAGHKNKAIAAQVGRSPASAGGCLRRQYLVGYTNPVEVFKARMCPETAARWAIEKPIAAQWGLLPAPAAQGVLDFGLGSQGGAA